MNGVDRRYFLAAGAGTLLARRLGAARAVSAGRPNRNGRGHHLL